MAYATIDSHAQTFSFAFKIVRSLFLLLHLEHHHHHYHRVCFPAVEQSKRLFSRTAETYSAMCNRGAPNMWTSLRNGAAATANCYPEACHYAESLRRRQKSIPWPKDHCRTESLLCKPNNLRTKGQLPKIYGARSKNRLLHSR